ncbi:hypothetical protein GCM10018965_038380 [Nonomuraea roseola]
MAAKSPTRRKRAVRMVAEVRPDYPTEWAAINAVAAKLGIGTAETLRKWVRQAPIDEGQRPGTTTDEAEELKRLRREHAELRRANEILKAASVHSTHQRNPIRDDDRGGVAWRGWLETIAAAQSSATAMSRAVSPSELVSWCTARFYRAAVRRPCSPATAQTGWVREA